jgi:hypothetical protein
VAGVHHQHRRLVVGDVGVHERIEADVVGALADVREQLADVHAALPYFLNVNGERISAPVLRSVAIEPPGSG